MAALNTKCRANFDEWLQSIPESELGEFVFVPKNDEVTFGSDDFKLVYCGVCQVPTATLLARQSLQKHTNDTVFQLSTAEPVGCHMIEARVNGQTENKQLMKLFKTSGSVANDPSRLAFALFPPSIASHCTGQHVRQALQESPFDGQSLVNKIHVQWGPDVKLEDGKPRHGANVVSFIYNKLPLSGYKVDGKKAVNKAARKGKNGMK